MATGRVAFTGETSAVVFEAILNRLPLPPVRLNPEIPAELERIISKSLEKDRETRYQTASDLRADLKRLKRDLDSGRVPAISAAEAAPLDTREVQDSGRKRVFETTEPSRVKLNKGARWKLVAGAISILVILGAFAVYYFQRQSPALTERDTVMLADFVNTTGEPVFEGTLKQALSVQLQQSPFLNIMSDRRARRTA